MAFVLSYSFGDFCAIKGVRDGQNLGSTFLRVSPDGVTSLELASSLVVHPLNLPCNILWTVCSLNHKELNWRWICYSFSGDRIVNSAQLVDW